MNAGEEDSAQPTGLVITRRLKVIQISLHASFVILQGPADLLPGRQKQTWNLIQWVLESIFLTERTLTLPMNYLGTFFILKKDTVFS